MSFIVAREFGRLLKLTPFASCRLNKHSSMTSKIVRAKLEGDERADALKQLQTTGWQVLDNRDALHKAFTFKNFNQAFGFMTRVALLAEKLDHHPEWSNVYNKVQVTLSTHDMNGLSTYDVQMAQFMDKCVASTAHNN